MSWLDWLWRAKDDPTRAWTRSPSLDLVLNLDRNSLCEVAPGDPVQHLSVLGPAHDSRVAARGVLQYPDLGLQVDVHAESGQVQGFVLEFTRGLPGRSTFAGVLTLGGRPLRWSETTTVDDALSALGQPTKRTDDGPDVELIYERGGGVEWMVSFGEDGLEDMMVLSEVGSG